MNRESRRLGPEATVNLIGGTRRLRTSIVALVFAALYLGSVAGASATGSAAQFSAVTVGYNHSCALTAAGLAYCWGDNEYGQLGDNSAGEDSAYPVEVIMPDGVSQFSSISAGFDATCALTGDGVAYCWGYNEYGQLGIGTNDDAAEPQPVDGDLLFSMIEAGPWVTCGVTKAGDGYCWGFNDYGQLGNDDHDDTESGLADANSPQLVHGGIKFKSISVGDNTTCGVSRRGVGYCWGTGNNGELGNGDYSVEDGGNGFDADSAVPVPVAGALKFNTIRTASEHSCGLTTKGAVYCWGDGTYGQLGIGSIPDGPDGNPFMAEPTLTLAPRAKKLFGSGYGWSTCIIDKSDHASCWGWNAGFDYDYDDEHQHTNGSILGTGSHAYQEESPASVIGGFRFVEIDSDYYHACGLTNSGLVYCWGWGYDGQFGTGYAESTYGPVLPVAWGE